MNLKNEPAAVIGTTMSVFAAVLVALQVFGVKLTTTQSDALLRLAESLAPLLLPALGFILVRSRVDGPETAKAKQDLIERLLETEVTK